MSALSRRRRDSPAAVGCSGKVRRLEQGFTRSPGVNGLVVSSGRISTGVRQLRTKSRVTVQTKSGLVRYILVRNLSTISIVMSGRRLTHSAHQPIILFSYEWLGSSGRNPLGCASTAATIRSGD